MQFQQAGQATASLTLFIGSPGNVTARKVLAHTSFRRQRLTAFLNGENILGMGSALNYFK